MSFGGGGGGQQSSNEFKPPGYTEQGWKDYLSNAQDLSGKGLSPYGGQTVANMSPMQAQGLQMLSDYATQGTPERGATGRAVMRATAGEMNPYAAQANPYMGENPYLSKMIDTSNAKIADQYGRVTAPGLNASMARAGAFGGSQWQQEQKSNQDQLLGALGANTNSLLSQNYNQSANLAEMGLNRGMSGWQSGIGNALAGGQLGLGQQQVDQGAIQAMIAGGAIPQQYQQQLLDAAGKYYGAQQQAPFTLSDFLGSALSRASGTGGTNTYTGNSGGASPWTTAAGLAGAGYGLFNQ